MHHADHDIDVTTGVRFYPLEIPLSMIIKIGAVVALGAPPEVPMTVRFTHTELRGRTLSSIADRPIFDDHVAADDISQVQVTSSLGEIPAKLVELVQNSTAPLFMLFDFPEFGLPIYTDIVRRFEKGEAS